MSNAQPSARRVVRPATQSFATHEDNWKEFLATRGREEEPQLCEVLVKSQQVMHDVAREFVDKHPNLKRVNTELAGFPWLTPVIGTGCLGDVSAASASRLRGLPAALAALWREQHDLPDGTELAALIRVFAESLVADRFPDLPVAQPTDLDDLGATHDELRPAAAAVLAAALLRRLQHTALAMHDAVPRSDPAIRPPAEHYRRADVVDDLVRPAAAALQQLHDGLSDKADEPLRLIVNQVHLSTTALATDPGTGGRELTASDVEAVRELAWLLMMRAVKEYPGWRDLLTRLVLQRKENHDGRSRPSIPRIGSAATWIKAALEEATNRSWREMNSLEAGGSRRTEFFESVAQVVSDQAALASSNKGLPRASVLVTSFDLELEMALVRKGRPFTVLVPFHFVYGKETEASQRSSLVWLEAEFTPPSPGKAVSETFSLSDFQPKWSILGQDVVADRDRPVVIRLTGSPLLEAPSLDTPYFDTTLRHQLLDTLMSGGGPRSRIQPARSETSEASTDYPFVYLGQAAILDDYSVMHQITAIARSGLPKSVIGTPVRWMARYWLGVGVQVDDQMIRLGLGAHVDTVSDRLLDLPLHGALVNRRFTPGEVEMLSWQGFDSVSASFHQTTEQLRHYSQHLTSPELQWPGPGPCRLGVEA